MEKYGLGSVVPNTVLLGDSEEEGSFDDYCRMIARFHDLKRNVLVLRNMEGRFPERRRRIDVWWGGLQHNGGLMLILAYPGLLTKLDKSGFLAGLGVFRSVDELKVPEIGRAACFDQVMGWAGW